MRPFALTLLLACAATPGIGALPPVSPTGLEPIHLFKIANCVVSIGVATTGYTNEKSFRIDCAKGEAEKVYTVRIVRIKRDEGKAMPMPMVVTYKLQI